VESNGREKDFMKILMVTQKVDLADDLLGFTHRWVEAFGVRTDKLYVSAIRIGEHRLTGNFVLLPMEKGRGGRVRKLATLIGTAGRLILKKEVDLVFVHMSPVFCLLLAPFTAAAGIPQVLWFTHRSAGLTLRFATWVVDRVVTASKKDFPIPSRKVIGTGHGIDCDHFTPGKNGETPAPGGMILSVGRISPIKNYESMISAFSMIAPAYGLSLTIVGAEGTPAQKDYFEKIKRMAAGTGHGGKIVFRGRIPHARILSYYRSSMLFVNLCDGAMDKTVLEAMSCGVPVVTTNRAFASLLAGLSPRLYVREKNPAAVAAAMEAVLQLSPSERKALGEKLRHRVVEGHSLEGLMDRMLMIFRQLKGAGPP